MKFSGQVGDEILDGGRVVNIKLDGVDFDFVISFFGDIGSDLLEGVEVVGGKDEFQVRIGGSMSKFKGCVLINVIRCIGDEYCFFFKMLSCDGGYG